MGDEEVAGQKNELCSVHGPGLFLLALCNAKRRTNHSGGQPTNNIFPSTALLIRMVIIERPLSQHQRPAKSREKR